MKQLPEVGVDRIWTATLNFILYKLEPNNEFVLKANDRIHKMAMDCVVNVLCDDRKFYKKIKEWKDGNEIKIHLTRVGVAEE